MKFLIKYTMTRKEDWNEKDKRTFALLYVENEIELFSKKFNNMWGIKLKH